MMENKDLYMDSKNSSQCEAECSEANKPCATVKSTVESMTEQHCVIPDVIPPGPVYVKIPVVLAETNVTIPVEATITLDHLATEIKRIKKNIFLTQSRLMPFTEDSKHCTGVLFISGFIRKNIEYATRTCSTPGSSNYCGDIRHCTVDTPFSFTTRIEFLRPPVFQESKTPRELEYFTDKSQSCDDCSEPVIGASPCDQGFFFTEFFNEKPFTELVRADIAEIDIHKDSTCVRKPHSDRLFTRFTEKVIINLTLKVLQKQQVKIIAICNER